MRAIFLPGSKEGGRYHPASCRYSPPRNSPGPGTRKASAAVIQAQIKAMVTSTLTRNKPKMTSLQPSDGRSWRQVRRAQETKYAREEVTAMINRDVAGLGLTREMAFPFLQVHASLPLGYVHFRAMLACTHTHKGTARFVSFCGSSVLLLFVG